MAVKNAKHVIDVKNTRVLVYGKISTYLSVIKSSEMMEEKVMGSELLPHIEGAFSCFINFVILNLRLENAFAESWS